MASGDTIFVLEPLGMTAPATLFATPDTVSDGSTPSGTLWVLDFDPTTAEFADWFFTVPSNYAGGGFTFSWKGGTDNTSVGTLEIELRMVVIADATILTGDLGLDAATAVTVTDTPPATPINKMNQSTTANLSHANAGSPSAGDRVGIRIKRDTATDTNTGDLQFLEGLLLET